MQIMFTFKRVAQILLIIIFLFALFQLFVHWNSIVYIVSGWQRTFNHAISTSLSEIKENRFSAGITLVVISFIYGVVHAIGPGHGKIIIATYVATHPQNIKKSLFLSFCGSLLQAVTAIVVVTLLLVILNQSRVLLHQSELWLERISYLIVSGLGGLLILKAIKVIYRQFKLSKPPRFRFFYPNEAGNKHILVYRSSSKNIDNNKIECGCGHKHTVDETELNGGILSNLLLILSMGVRPCSGAILILILSFITDLYLWGILATLLMALGTSLTIQIIAAIVHYSREWAIKLTSKSTKLSLLPPFIWFTAGCLLIITGLLLYQSVSLVETQPILTPRRVL